MLYVVDTSMFSSEDFLLFLESSEYIQKVEKERRDLRRSNAKKTREEIFEISEMTDNDIFKIMCNDSDPKESSLSASIENLFQYFSEDVSVENEGAPSRTVDREFHRPIIVDACPKKYATVKYEPEYIRRARLRNEKPSVKTRPKSMPVSIIESNCFDNKIKLTPLTKLKPETCKLSEEDTINLTVKEKISLFNKMVKNDTECKTITFSEKLKTTIRTKSNHSENIKTEQLRIRSESETFCSQSVKERIKIFENEKFKSEVKNEKYHSNRENLTSGYSEQRWSLKETQINKKCEKEYNSNTMRSKNSCNRASTGRVSDVSDFNYQECFSSTLKSSEFNLESMKIQKNRTNVALTIKSIRERKLLEVNEKHPELGVRPIISVGTRQNNCIQETRLDVKLTQTLPKISNRRKLTRVSSKNEICRTTSSCAGIGGRAAFKKDSRMGPSSNEWSNAMIKIN